MYYFCLYSIEHILCSTLIIKPDTLWERNKKYDRKYYLNIEYFILNFESYTTSTRNFARKTVLILIYYKGRRG
jgi:ATP-dependent phosphoenolpyruvate carboxykinase